MTRRPDLIPSHPSVQVIERIFTLMDVLASREDALSLKEISQKTGLHPSTAHRILNDLALGRYVDRPEPGSYRLGMRLLELGNLVKGRLSVRDTALGPMRELHKLIQQPVNLSVRQGDEIVYVERAYSERSGMQVVRAIGGHAPLHLTSVGKLFLAADDPQRVRAYAMRTGLAGTTDLRGHYAPYLLIIGLFWFLYIYMPNTRVRWRAAFIGALFGGAAWVGVGAIFTRIAVYATQAAATTRGPRRTSSE